MHVVHFHLGFERIEPADLRERFLTQTRLADYQARSGARVTVLQRFFRDDDLTADGVDYRLRSDGNELLPRPFTRPMKLYRLLPELDPDVVHFNGLVFPLHLAEIRARLPRRAVLVAQHHGEPPGGGMKRVAQKACLKAADGFLFTAAAIADPWRAEGLIGEDQPVFEVVESSSDLEPVPRQEARAKTKLDGWPAVLWVGRLHERKDPLTALSTFERAAEKLPDARLHLVYQEAPLLSAIEKRVRASATLSSRVRFVGKVSHAELAAWFSASDVFLTTSPSEGSNYALIEAMACGTPAVATDIPANRKVGGAQARLFPVGDARAGGAAILRVAQKPPSRAALRAHFEANLSWSAIARQSLAAYRALSGRREP